VSAYSELLLAVEMLHLRPFLVVLWLVHLADAYMGVLPTEKDQDTSRVITAAVKEGGTA
jgi:hypothetical protein